MTFFLFTERPMRPQISIGTAKLLSRTVLAYIAKLQASKQKKSIDQTINQLRLKDHPLVDWKFSEIMKICNVLVTKGTMILSIVEILIPRETARISIPRVAHEYHSILVSGKYICICICCFHGTRIKLCSRADISKNMKQFNRLCTYFYPITNTWV